MIPETEKQQEAKSVCPGSMLRLIRVDTLRRVHDVSFIAEGLICVNTHKENTGVYIDLS